MHILKFWESNRGPIAKSIMTAIAAYCWICVLFCDYITCGLSNQCRGPMIPGGLWDCMRLPLPFSPALLWPLPPSYPLFTLILRFEEPACPCRLRTCSSNAVWFERNLQWWTLSNNDTALGVFYVHYIVRDERSQTVLSHQYSLYMYTIVFGRAYVIVIYYEY